MARIRNQIDEIPCARHFFCYWSVLRRKTQYSASSWWIIAGKHKSARHIHTHFIQKLWPLIIRHTQQQVILLADSNHQQQQQQYIHIVDTASNPSPCAAAVFKPPSGSEINRVQLASGRKPGLETSFAINAVILFFYCPRTFILFLY